MQNSWEIFSFLLIIIGSVLGFGVFFVAVVLLVQDVNGRKILFKASLAALTSVSAVLGIAAAYSRLWCSHHLFRKGKRLPKPSLP